MIYSTIIQDAIQNQILKISSKHLTGYVILMIHMDGLQLVYTFLDYYTRELLYTGLAVDLTKRF